MKQLMQQRRMRPIPTIASFYRLDVDLGDKVVALDIVTVLDEEGLHHTVRGGRNVRLHFHGGEHQ